MSLLESALRYIADGIPVFPCEVGGKRPSCANGFKDATTDEAQIRAWWAEADWNIGTSPEDWGAAVVDLDAKGGKRGPEAWGALCAENGWASDTFTVETPSGGRHLFYSGSVKTTAEKLGPGIDTRGRGGYVVLPPSVVDGRPYKVLKNAELAELPSGIDARLATSSVAVAASDVELDGDAAVARARSLLADLARRGDVAVSGSGGNDRTYRLAAELLNLGLSTETAWELLAEEWNPSCMPPWEGDELLAIVEHASEYAQNGAGVWAVPPAAEAFGETVARLNLAAGSPQRLRTSRFLTVAQMANIPDPSWLVKDVVMSAGTCLLVGAWATYKSFLALDLALSVATGSQTAFGPVPEKTGPVVYACLEGMTGIAKARRRAWCIAHGLEQDADMPFFLGSAPLISDHDDCLDFLEQLQALKPVLIVIDTVSQSMAGLDETRDATTYIKFARELSAATGAASLHLHHMGHDKAKGARGGTVYPSGFDSYLEVEAKGDKRVEVWVRKQKDAEERSRPFTMQGRTVGPALVFQHVDPRQHNEAIAASDPFSWQSVGAALEALEARGRDRSVTTAVLSQQIFPKHEGEAEGAYVVRVAKAGKALGALAKNRLRAYCEQGTFSLVWFLPIADEAAA